MDQHVNTSEPGFCFFDATGHIVWFTAVGQKELGAAADFFETLHCLSRISIFAPANDGHFRAGLGKGQSRGSADAASTAGDEGHFSFDVHRPLLERAAAAVNPGYYQSYRARLRGVARARR